jgi:hypothetical protein
MSATAGFNVRSLRTLFSNAEGSNSTLLVWGALTASPDDEHPIRVYSVWGLKPLAYPVRPAAGW